MHILPNTSQSNGNQAMKFGQVIEHNKRKNFLKITQNQAGGLVPYLLLFFKKVLYEENASGLQLSFNILR